MRPTLGLAHAATILLDRLAMAGQPGAIRSRPVGLPVAGCGIRRSRRPAARSRPGPGRTFRRGPSSTASRAAGGNDDPIGIGGKAIAQLDLDPEHGLKTRLLDGRLRPNDAVESLMVRDSKPGQTQLGGPFGQLIGCRGTVEERKIRVAMKLGICDHLDDR